MATKSATNPSFNAGTAIISAAFELVAVGLIALLAGINDDMGKAMVAVMVGFWIIYMITNSAVISSLGGFVATITGNQP